VLSAFYKQLSQFLLWPAERKTLLYKKCIISLAVNNLRVKTKQRHFGIFPFCAGMQINSIEAKFANCMRRITVPLENHSRHTSTLGLYKSRANLFCTVTPNTCGSSVWISFILHSSGKIFLHHLQFCKTRKYLIYPQWNRTKSKCF
jgi:hypothetical protein